MSLSIFTQMKTNLKLVLALVLTAFSIVLLLVHAVDAAMSARFGLRGFLPMDHATS
jgi:hypothetical protein